MGFKVCSNLNTENCVEPEDKEGLNNDKILSLLFMLLFGMYEGCP